MSARKKPMSIRVPEPLADELKEKAFAEGVSLTELINRFSRQGLRRSATENHLPFINLPEVNGNGHGFALPHQPLGQTNGQVSAQMVLAAERPEPDGQSADKRDLWEGIDTFVEVLEASMAYLTNEYNREHVLNTIGDLAKLKTRLKLDPCFQPRSQSN